MHQQTKRRLRFAAWGALGLVCALVLLWFLPALMLSWTDAAIRLAAPHVRLIRSIPSGTDSDYWSLAADLAYYLTVLVAFAGSVGTFVVVIYGATQLRVGIAAMRAGARQQQMRLQFDLDLALLANPELSALMEGQFSQDAATLARFKAHAFAHAFLNGCDTVHDYYTQIDPDEAGSYWRAWRNQLSYYLTERPELRAIARQSIKRGFYTEPFRNELLDLIVAAEQADAKPRMPKIVVPVRETADGTVAEVRELSGSLTDIETLRRFYNDVYAREFPDPDERESFENMKEYLGERKTSGWYGKNNYHILVAERGGETAGLCVADYLAEANVGVIEFLVVMPEARGQGLGGRMLDHLEALIAADARAALGSGPRGIVAEMNDPFRASLLDDTMDPFDRAMLWHRWGFRLLDLPYVQPPLSAGQEAVTCLVLIAKPMLPPFDAWSAEVVLALLRDYLIYAMRFSDPWQSRDFVAMATWLRACAQVPLVSLAAFIGREPEVPWIEIRDRRDPAFAGAMALYQSGFTGDIAIADDDFAQFLDARALPDLRYTYHLWAAPMPAGDDVMALASFFTFRHGGFGGYTIRRRLPRPVPDVPLSVGIASVEVRMRRDNPRAQGWLIECDTREIRRQPASIFYRHGFREVRIEYRQPPLPGSPYEFAEAPVLALLFKNFGSRVRAPALSVAVFLGLMEEMFGVVYGMADPGRSAYFRHLRAQLPADGAQAVPFYEKPRGRKGGSEG